MYVTLHRYLVSLLLLACLGFTTAVSAQSDDPVSNSAANQQTVVGKVVFLRGTATATAADGSEKKLARNVPIQLGDTITTGARSSVLMRLADGSKFELGAESSLVVSDFIYKENVEEDKVSATVLKGVFRFVTGKVAKQRPESMDVKAGVTATIGIRGTHVLGKLEGEEATIILLEPEEGDDRKTAINVANNAGAVDIDEPGFGTVVADANTAPTPPRRMRMQTIQNLMRSMQSIQRIPNVRPRF
jgi:hypothetical protein